MALERGALLFRQAVSRHWSDAGFWLVNSADAPQYMDWTVDWILLLLLHESESGEEESEQRTSDPDPTGFAGEEQIGIAKADEPAAAAEAAGSTSTAAKTVGVKSPADSPR